MFVSGNWKDYELLYCGGGEKYERWGDVILRRPDPQAVWPVVKDGKEISMDELAKPNALYTRSDQGGGAWTKLKSFPSTWKIDYDSLGKKLTFIIEPTAFKHTGLFPEQASNWDFCGDLIEKAKAAGKKDIRILNLFAYTGAQTLACSAHGADEGMIARAKENIKASGLEGNYVRFIAEDCMKFVEREIRRGRKYDGIIMDPPSYGRGPKGELWKLEDSFYDLVKLCSNVISDDPLFFIASSYATGITAQASGQIFKLALPSGKVEAEELMLPVSKMGVLLPCGQTARWSAK